MFEDPWSEKFYTPEYGDRSNPMTAAQRMADPSTACDSRRGEDYCGRVARAAQTLGSLVSSGLSACLRSLEAV